MSHPSRPGRRRAWLPAIVATAVITVLPLAVAGPAGAATASLTTTDGVGIRVDENAILGPALEEIETELQPFVDQMIYDGAVENTPVGDPDAINVSSNLELGFDVLPPATGRPDGGLSVDASVEDIDIEYRKDAWWHSECGITVNPYDASIDVTAEVNRDRLPDAPLELQPIVADWDEDPDTSTSGACWTYLIDDFFNGFFGSGEEDSIADNIEDELNATAQDLIDDLWADHVVPVIDSLDSYGITFNQVRTDDHGLIVTADVDATGGLNLPGSSNPIDVINAQDAGVTSDVNTLLGNRADDIIVSVHPNVANQYMYALNTQLNGNFGSANVSGNIEDVLLDPTVHGNYADDGWTVSLLMGSTTEAPYLQPTGPGAEPRARMDDVFVIARNSTTGGVPVAVFRGSVSDVGVDTVVRPGSDKWGPSYDTSTMQTSLSLRSGNPDVTAFNPDPAGMLPYAKASVDYFNANILTPYVSLAPVTIGGLSVDLCTTCGRYPGDQRYTETFQVNAAP